MHGRRDTRLVLKVIRILGTPVLAYGVTHLRFGVATSARIKYSAEDKIHGNIRISFRTRISAKKRKHAFCVMTGERP